MILIVTDTHCYYDAVNKHIEYAENVLGLPIACVIHLGDFGLYASHLRAYFRKHHKRFLKPLYLIEGNHEDFYKIQKLVKEYEDCFTYLPRASLHTIDGHRFLALGGTGYMDPLVTGYGTLITNPQIDRCLSFPPEATDIIITHDCPTGIGVPNSPGVHYYRNPGFPRSEELTQHFNPRLWLFGHHHRWHDYVDGQTRYHGICIAWRGFAILDANFNLIKVNHEVRLGRSSFFERILASLHIIRPSGASSASTQEKRETLPLFFRKKSPSTPWIKL